MVKTKYYASDVEKPRGKGDSPDDHPDGGSPKNHPEDND
jgi:hypothetical protein